MTVLYKTELILLWYFEVLYYRRLTKSVYLSQDIIVSKTILPPNAKMYRINYWWCDDNNWVDLDHCIVGRHLQASFFQLDFQTTINKQTTNNNIWTYIELLSAANKTFNSEMWCDMIIYNRQDLYISTSSLKEIVWTVDEKNMQWNIEFYSAIKKHFIVAGAI